MCCTEFIVKYVLFFFNLAITLTGVALIGVGIAVIYQIEGILELIPWNLNSLPTFIIVAGAFIFVIAFFGCCGAIKENSCLLITYAVFLVILAALKIWLTVVIFQNLGNLRESFETWVTDAFNDPSLRDAFHENEAYFRCCGTTGANSYIAAGLPVPGTCCGGQVNNICSGATYGGCIQAIGDYFEKYGEGTVAVLIITIIVELVALVFSLYMNYTVSSKRRATY